jgi:hypothetical protein
MNAHMNAQRLQEAQLRRLHHFKRTAPPADAPLGQEMISFFKQSLQKRHSRLGVIAETWAALVPATLQDHCGLQSYARGNLTVVVDSAAHLYELKQLLLAGLEQQLLLAAKAASLRKIILKRGHWDALR